MDKPFLEETLLSDVGVVEVTMVEVGKQICV